MSGLLQLSFSSFQSPAQACLKLPARVMACQGCAQGTEGWDSHSLAALSRMENPKRSGVDWGQQRGCGLEGMGPESGTPQVQPRRAGEMGKVRFPGTSSLRPVASDFPTHEPCPCGLMDTPESGTGSSRGLARETIPGRKARGSRRLPTSQADHLRGRRGR